MADRQAQFSGTTDMRPGQEIDAAALQAWLKVHVPDFEGPLRIEQFKGGQSNPTYKLSPASLHLSMIAPDFRVEKQEKVFMIRLR